MIELVVVVVVAFVVVVVVVVVSTLVVVVVVVVVVVAGLHHLVLTNCHLSLQLSLTINSQVLLCKQGYQLVVRIRLRDMASGVDVVLTQW